MDKVLIAYAPYVAVIVSTVWGIWVSSRKTKQETKEAYYDRIDRDNVRLRKERDAKDATIDLKNKLIEKKDAEIDRLKAKNRELLAKEAIEEERKHEDD